MKLYEVPRNTMIRVPGCTLDILFHHVDGMYSYCTLPDKSVVHLSAIQEVEIVKESSSEA